MIKYIEIDAETKEVLVGAQEQPWLPDLSGMGRVCIDVTNVTEFIPEGTIYNEDTHSFKEKVIPYDVARQAAYPSLEEQADMQFHDLVDGTTTWQDAISAVKAQYPKG